MSAAGWRSCVCPACAACSSSNVKFCAALRYFVCMGRQQLQLAWLLGDPTLPHPSSPPLPSPPPPPNPLRPVLFNTLQQTQQVGATGGSRARCDPWAGSCTPDGKADQPASRKAVLGTLMVHEQPPGPVHRFAACLRGTSKALWSLLPAWACPYGLEASHAWSAAWPTTI